MDKKLYYYSIAFNHYFDRSVKSAEHLTNKN